MKIKLLAVFITVMMLLNTAVCYSAENVVPVNDATPTDEALAALAKKVHSLKTLSADLTYSHCQPLFDTESIRIGKIHYQYDPNVPKLRINFSQFTQDGVEQKKYNDDFFFDGIWITRVDSLSKTVTAKQLTTEDKPVPPFKLLSRYFPIVGFTETEDLKKQFDIEFNPPATANGPLRFTLTPLPESIYAKDYKSISFVVPAGIMLATEFIAQTTSGELVNIKFSNIRINKPLSKSVFKFEIPKGYTHSIHPIQ